MNYAIKADGVYKTFLVDRYHATLYRIFKRKLLGRSLRPKTITALNDINFEIHEGENVAIVGNNGSGKTTLLKVIAGLYRPNKGCLSVNGKITVLSGLGLGMYDELSVEENMYLYGMIYGLRREIIRKNFHEIIEWAELQNFTGAKFKTLSSGMKARLAFSVTRHMESDILLFDEALSAGDKDFRDKCNAVFKDYINKGVTLIVATHNTTFVKNFCQKTLWLRKGHQMAFEKTEEVLPKYLDVKNS